MSERVIASPLIKKVEAIQRVFTDNTYSETDGYSAASRAYHSTVTPFIGFYISGSNVLEAGDKVLEGARIAVRGTISDLIHKLDPKNNPGNLEVYRQRAGFIAAYYRACKDLHRFAQNKA